MRYSFKFPCGFKGMTAPFLKSNVNPSINLPKKKKSSQCILTEKSELEEAMKLNKLLKEENDRLKIEYARECQLYMQNSMPAQ